MEGGEEEIEGGEGKKKGDEEWNCRVSNIVDHSLKQNYVHLHKIIFISCNFAGLRIIGEISTKYFCEIL